MVLQIRWTFMKTVYKRNQRVKAARLTPPRSRSKSTRLPRRNRVSPAPGLLARRPRAKAKLTPAPATEPTDRSGPMADSLQLYLREIGQVNLLTPAEEIA